MYFFSAFEIGRCMRKKIFMGARGLFGHGMPSKFCSHFFALAISFVPGLLFSENYPYGEVIKTHGGGVGPGSFWIYEPAAPKPQKAPVVFFYPDIPRSTPSTMEHGSIILCAPAIWLSI